METELRKPEEPEIENLSAISRPLGRTGAYSGAESS